jgi:hypothetical protein
MRAAEETFRQLAAGSECICQIEAHSVHLSAPPIYLLAQPSAAAQKYLAELERTKLIRRVSRFSGGGQTTNFAARSCLLERILLTKSLKHSRQEIHVIIQRDT